MPESVLRLAPALESTQAEGLRSELLERRGRDLAIDAGAALRLGTLCLQVLVSAAKTWAADGQSMRIINASADFKAAAETLALPLPVEEQA